MSRAGTPPAGKDWAGIVGSAFFAAVGVYVFIASLGMSPMAAMFPRTIGAIMAALCVVQIAAAFTGLSGRGVEQGAGIAEQAEGLGRRLTLLGVMVSWAILFPLVGMFVTSSVAAVILMFTGQFGRLTAARLAAYLAGVILMVGAFHLLMTNVLNISLPRGLLF